jgi:hypothetical protein
LDGLANLRLVGHVADTLTVDNTGTLALPSGITADPQSFLASGDPTKGHVVSLGYGYHSSNFGVFNGFGFAFEGIENLELDGGIPGETFYVGDGTNSLDWLGPNLAITIKGQSNDSLVVNDNDQPSPNKPVLTSRHPTFTLTGGNINRDNSVSFVLNGTTYTVSTHASIGYSGIAKLELDGGNTGNTFDVEGTTAGTPVAIQAGSGGDTVNVGSSTNTLDPLQGVLSIYGQGANTSLNVYDQGTSSPQVYHVNATQLQRYPSPPLGNPTQTIDYFTVGSVNVHGSNAYDTWFVYSTSPGTATALYSDTPAGTGNGNAFIVDGSTGMDNILGPLALHGANIYDYAEDYDYHNPSAHTYTLSTPNPTTTLLQRDGGIAPITHDGIGELILYVPLVGGNHVNVQGVASGVFDNLTASNGDQDVIGSLAPTNQGGTMSAILGAVAFGFESNTVTAPVTLTLDDSGDNTTAPRQVSIGTLALTPSINLPVISNLGGNGEQVYWNLPSVSSVTVHGRAGGNETFAVQGLLNNIPEPTIMAGGSNNTLQGPNSANTWQITGPNAGTLDGLLSFSSVQTLIGGAAADTFAFHTGGSLGGTLNGGGGTNTLDYTAYQGNILVDLLLHTASLVGQGISNIANVTGSNGNSLMVGDANPNVLVGGTGRNVIIGDGGSDKITGGAGFNLLIGGITSYDTTPAALQALQVYWDNPNVTTLDGLVNPLKKGVTVNGQFLVFNKTTVQNDNTPDSVVGGSAPNWFIADNDDTINNGIGPGPKDRLLRI